MRLYRVAGAFAIVASSIAVVMLACTSLGPIATNVCGNSIIEPEAGEQCDLWDYQDAFACFKPDAGARACHVACGDGGACPSGWGCGIDGVCRAPTPSYKLTAVQVPADVRELSLADFDGDGRLDVVTRGLGATEIFFFDGSGVVTGTGGPISLTRGRATSGRTSADAGASLVAFDTSVTAGTSGGFVISGTGINVWRGQPDRTLSAVLFSSFPIESSTDSRVIPAKVLSPSPHEGDDDIVVFAQTAIGDAGVPIGLVATFDVKKGFQAAYAMLGTDGGVRNDIPVGRVPPSAPCDSTLVGYKGSTTATTFRSCDDAGNALTPSVPIGLPPNVTFQTAINGPVFLFDADRDGVLDAVTGGAKAIQIALGNSDGSFKPGVTVPAPAMLGTLLAVGFIDGDNVLDFVDTSGIVLSAASTRIPSTLTLTYAQVRDTNNDGHADVVGISNAGVDFYAGTGTGLMNHRLYDIANATSLALGDLDGDSNVDLVVSVAGNKPPLYVLWGTTAGFPSEPAIVGTLPYPAEHLSTGKLTWFFGDQADAVSSIVAIGEQDVTKFVVIPIQGHTDRQLTSPFILGDRDAGGSPGLANPDLPLVGALGTVPLDASPTTSLAVLAASPAQDAGFVLRSWTAPVTSVDQVFDVNALVGPAAGGLSIPITTTLAAQGIAMTLVDLDPSQHNGDELVAVVPSSGPDGSLNVARSAFGAWMPISSEPFAGQVRTFDEPNLVIPVRVTHADFDGDGNEDVLLVYQTTTDAGFEIDAEVRFSDGNGHLVDKVVVPDVTSAAPINALGTPGKQLMTIGKDGMKMFALTACSSGAMRCFDGGTIVNKVVMNAAVDIVCGDVNGDGVDDVVAATRTFIDVFLGSAALP